MECAHNFFLVPFLDTLKVVIGDSNNVKKYPLVWTTLSLLLRYVCSYFIIEIQAVIGYVRSFLVMASVDLVSITRKRCRYIWEDLLLLMN